MYAQLSFVRHTGDLTSYQDIDLPEAVAENASLSRKQKFLFEQLEVRP